MRCRSSMSRQCYVASASTRGQKTELCHRERSLLKVWRECSVQLKWRLGSPTRSDRSTAITSPWTRSSMFEAEGTSHIPPSTRSAYARSGSRTHRVHTCRWCGVSDIRCTRIQQKVGTTVDILSAAWPLRNEAGLAAEMATRQLLRPWRRRWRSWRSLDRAGIKRVQLYLFSHCIE